MIITMSKYWLGQKVRSGFSIWKNELFPYSKILGWPTNFFVQPNISTGKRLKEIPNM